MPQGNPSRFKFKPKRFKYTERLAEAKIALSVVSVGDSCDNTPAETINGLFKAEIIHRRGPWRSFDAVEYATLEWVDWFNNLRLLEPIGNIPPAEAETHFYAALERSEMAAKLKQISLRQTRRGSMRGLIPPFLSLFQATALLW